MSSSNHIKNVAIVGATGNSGSFMAAELLKTGKHVVTAITRADSEGKPAEGLKVAIVDYSKPETLVTALQGQDALIITLRPRVPEDTQLKLIRAAAAAGVQFVLPNEWCPDTADEGLRNDTRIFSMIPEAHRQIEEEGKGRMSWIAVTTGFWYEWSLAIPNAYGFDIQKREVTFFDDGKTPVNTTTWPQQARAVAALLSLPIRAEPGSSDPARCLDHFRNKRLYVSSFLVSQQDMFESLLRVTGTKEADWTVRHEPAHDRWARASEALAKPGFSHADFAIQMYTRVFFKGENGRPGLGNYGAVHGGLHNDLLGLPVEDLDPATKIAVERSANNPWPAAAAAAAAATTATKSS